MHPSRFTRQQCRLPAWRQCSHPRRWRCGHARGTHHDGVSRRGSPRAAPGGYVAIGATLDLECGRATSRPALPNRGLEPFLRGKSRQHCSLISDASRARRDNGGGVDCCAIRLVSESACGHIYFVQGRLSTCRCAFTSSASALIENVSVGIRSQRRLRMNATGGENSHLARDLELEVVPG